MKRKVLLFLFAVVFAVNITACGKTIDNKTTNSEDAVEEKVEDNKEPQTEATIEEKEEEETSNSFGLFAGNYSFMSGAGAWSTDISLFDDGTFTGEFHDSDMGDMGDDYPNGTVYLCKFSGKFTELVQKDDFTYTCSIESMTLETEAGKEEISKEDGIKYVYAGAYGFDNAKDFEFYLPGKNVGELNSDFVSWMSLRYNQPYPDTLPHRAFNNLSENQGFEENSAYMEDMTAEYPESIQVLPYELAGKYHNANLNIDMIISAYTDYVEGDEASGNITWEIPEDAYIWNDEATFLPSSNGFDVKPGFYGEYKIIVTDNTNGNLTIHLYDSNGYDCGEYVMTEHFES